MPGLLSWVVVVIRGSKFKASDVVPGPGSNIRHPLSVFPFLHRVLRDQFPGFISTMRVLRLPAAHPAALRCLRLAVPRWHSLQFAPRRPSAPPRPGVGHPVSPAGNLRGDDRISQVPGEPQLSVCTCSHPTPAGLLAPDHYSAAAWPLVSHEQRLPRKVFRSSIAWLPDSLSTPRRVRYLPRRKTRFRPLVRRYRTGFPPAGFLRKVSVMFPHISSSFPKLLGAMRSTAARKQVAVHCGGPPHLRNLGDFPKVRRRRTHPQVGESCLSPRRTRKSNFNPPRTGGRLR
jgi:hypothetical protein